MSFFAISALSNSDIPLNIVWVISQLFVNQTIYAERDSKIILV